MAVIKPAVTLDVDAVTSVMLVSGPVVMAETLLAVIATAVAAVAAV